MRASPPCSWARWRASRRRPTTRARPRRPGATRRAAQRTLALAGRGACLWQLVARRARCCHARRGIRARIPCVRRAAAAALAARSAPRAAAHAPNRRLRGLIADGSRAAPQLRRGRLPGVGHHAQLDAHLRDRGALHEVMTRPGWTRRGRRRRQGHHALAVHRRSSEWWSGGHRRGRVLVVLPPALYKHMHRVTHALAPRCRSAAHGCFGRSGVPSKRTAERPAASSARMLAWLVPSGCAATSAACCANSAAACAVVSPCSCANASVLQLPSLVPAALTTSRGVPAALRNAVGVYLCERGAIADQEKGNKKTCYPALVWCWVARAARDARGATQPRGVCARTCSTRR